MLGYGGQGQGEMSLCVFVAKRYAKNALKCVCFRISVYFFFFLNAHGDTQDPLQQKVGDIVLRSHAMRCQARVAVCTYVFVVACVCVSVLVAR